MICFGLLAVISGCGTGKPEKVTEIPVTTQSKEALNSLRQGLALSDLGDYQKSRGLFIKAIEQDPKLSIAYLFKATTDVSPKEASDDVEKAKAGIEGASEWEKLYCDYTVTFFTSDWNKRLEIAKKIAAAYPDAARPQVDLGNTYRSANDVANERACFTKAVELDPKWVGGYVGLLNSYLFSAPTDFKKAEGTARKMVELAPASPGAEIALGDCYRAQNNLQKARDAYSKAVDLDPAAPEAYYKKGHANSFLGNLEEARQNYSDGSKHDESIVMGGQFIAYTYLYGNDPKGAMNSLEGQLKQIEASGNKDAKTMYAKSTFLQDYAGIALFTGDVAKLKEIIGQLEPISLQMGNDVGTDAAKLSQKAGILQWKALLAASEGNFSLAGSTAEEIKSTVAPINDPLKLDGYEFALGYIALKQKKFPEAVAHFEKTQQVLISNKYWLAMAYDAAGNKDRAKKLFNEIADYNFNSVDFALVRNEVKKKMTSN